MNWDPGRRLDSVGANRAACRKNFRAFERFIDQSVAKKRNQFRKGVVHMISGRSWLWFVIFALPPTAVIAQDFAKKKVAEQGEGRVLFE